MSINNRLIIRFTFLLFVNLCLPKIVVGKETYNADRVALQKGGTSSSTSYVISWSVLDETSNTEEVTSASYRLKGAIDQSSIGRCESADYKAYIGFLEPKSIWIMEATETQATGSKTKEKRLFQNYPNPFGQTTVIRYYIADPRSLAHEKSNIADPASRIRLEIYDLGGRLVRTLVNSEQQPGYNEVTWDRTDDSGRKVPLGMYFYRLLAGNYMETKKLIVLQ